MKRLKRNTAFNIILISAVIFLLISRNSQSKQFETARNELIRQVSKQLKRQETETRNRINEIETKIETIKQSDTLILKRIETAEYNYRNIIRNLKTIENDKTKKDNEIINADSNTDWEWFIGRFPKSKNHNGLLIKTDTTFRKSSHSGQHESH